MQKKTKVLIADDEERLRITLGRMLTTRGLDVATFGTGQEAVERLKTEPFDVVLLDLRMPGMSGLETLARIREVDPGVEVILLSGHASMEAAREATKLGVFDYLMKPCPVEEILLKIESACERRQERRQEGTRAAARQDVKKAGRPEG